MEQSTPMVSQTPMTDAREAQLRSSDEVVIKCSGLSKTFRDFWLRPRVRAVDNVNIEVRRGEVFGLLGPNGSGKSTTIKMILGLLHSTGGRIAVLGRRPDDVDVKKRIGYLPEESYLYRFLNAQETLDYYGRLFHQSSSQRARRIEMLLEMVGLEGVQRRQVGEYSKGMQRRIGLAQALINDPELLILDEPTTGMDPLGTRQIKDLILKLKERGKTILLCSHLLADVQDVCDHVSIMFGGKVIEEGRLDTLLTQQDTTTIDAQKLDDQTIQEIEEVLSRRGRHIDRISNPRQSLEHLFLDLIKREQDRGTATAGARAGGRIAAFLGGDEEAVVTAEESTKQVIDQLTNATPTETAKAPQQDEAPAAPVETAEDASFIGELTQKKEAPAPVPSKPLSQPPASTEAAQPKPPEDEDVDRDVLDSLLGGNDEEDSGPRDRS